jgi:5'-3' exoribonuclease 2
MMKLYVIREWMWLECASVPTDALPFGLDLERIVDDFVFMCFLVGNDFLPHIPALKIVDGGIDCLIVLYK